MTLVAEYVAKVQERIDAERAALGRGAATTFDEYKKRVGVVSGLEASLTILHELLKTTPTEERN